MDDKTTLGKLQFLDAVDEMLEILDGFRAKVIAHGYSETAAEQMTMDLHAKFMREM